MFRQADIRMVWRDVILDPFLSESEGFLRWCLGVFNAYYLLFGGVLV